MSYNEQLENLGLSRLTTRKVRSDLIQTFKIINGIDKVDIFFEIDSGGRRGHSSKLFKKRSRLDNRKYAFSNRIQFPRMMLSGGFFIFIAGLAVWLSGNTLASINVVALRQTRLVLGWVTVCGRVNHLGM